MASKALVFAEQNHARFLDELKALLRIPSVSTLPENKEDCRKAAEFLVADLKKIGIENVGLIETEGHPLVYGDWLHAAGKPTVLIYGHYDVQPAEPLDEWLSPPFEPTERNGNLYARGAVDDKGQVWAQIKALESLMKADGKLPMNVRVLFEGEEEVGGEGIANYVASKPANLSALKVFPTPVTRTADTGASHTTTTFANTYHINAQGTPTQAEIEYTNRVQSWQLTRSGRR